MKRTRPKVILAVVIPLLAILVLVRETRLTQQLKVLTTENDQLASERDASRARMEQLESKIDELQIKTETATEMPSDATLQQALARVATLEAQLQNLSPQTGGRGILHRPGFPEYDPAQPPSPATIQSPQINEGPPKRAWGHEQITGAPDTDRAGDIQTAWASREPDGGAEWLWADFERAVELAQVRVRETYNPGAISQVTAVVNGQQVTLWEGTAAGGEAPRDFVVNAPPGISAQSIVVHLDTTRVAGWNEIDAVELIGSDGSHQWVKSSNASSSYSDQRPVPTGAAVSEDQVLLVEPPVQPPR